MRTPRPGRRGAAVILGSSRAPFNRVAPTRQVRLQWLAERLHELGPRPIYDLLNELVEAFGPGVLDRVEAYARLDPRLVSVLGGDRFPPRLAAIAGGRQ